MQKRGSAGGGLCLRVSRTSCSLSRACRRRGAASTGRGWEVRCRKTGSRQGSLASRGTCGAPWGAPSSSYKHSSPQTLDLVLPVLLGLSDSLCQCFFSFTPVSICFSLFVSSPFSPTSQRIVKAPFPTGCFLSCLDGDWHLFAYGGSNQSILFTYC